MLLDAASRCSTARRAVAKSDRKRQRRQVLGQHVAQRAQHLADAETLAHGGDGRCAALHQLRQQRHHDGQQRAHDIEPAAQPAQGAGQPDRLGTQRMGALPGCRRPGQRQPPARFRPGLREIVPPGDRAASWTCNALAGSTSARCACPPGSCARSCRSEKSRSRRCGCSRQKGRLAERQSSRLTYSAPASPVSN